MNGALCFDFGLVSPITSLFQEKEKDNLKVSIANEAVSCIYCCSIWTPFIYISNTQDTHGMRKMIITMIKFYKRKIESPILGKKKNCLSLFDEVDILGLSEIVLLCVACLLNPDWSKA